MNLLIVGINHETAPVEMREKVAFTPDQLGHALPDLCGHAGVDELAILSTCNRTEVIAVAEPGRENEISHWLADYHHMEPASLEDSLYVHAGDGALDHLFRVAAGLDSMVLGEPQILGQVKDCFNAAITHQTVGPELTALAQATNRIAKRVRTETAIGESSVSSASTAVALARQLFTNLAECRALFVGAGETVELAARHLMSAGVRTVTIANRTLQNAETLAQELGGSAIDLSGIPVAMEDADIVIASTASQLPIIGKGTVERALRARRHRPIFMVDLAVPRDIEPEVAGLRDVYLYSIDDLQGIIDENISARQQEAEKAGELIGEFVSTYADQRKTRSAVDTLVRFRAHHQEIMSQELDKGLKRLDAGDDPQKVLTALANQLTNKLIHTPSIRLKDAGRDGRDELMEAIEHLYDLPEGRQE